MRLSAIPRHPAPVPGLEQYSTPGDIAAAVLYAALAHGDVADRRVIDLGCGTGVFTLGALLIGAQSATGVDVDDEALKVARTQAQAWGLAAEFRHGRIEDQEGSFDTAIMNPPFGAQFAARGADVVFVTNALRLAPVVYSLHAKVTRPHLLKRFADASPRVLASFQFPLPRQFHFHTKEKVLVEVDLIRFQRGGGE
jgi:putative methylase